MRAAWPGESGQIRAAPFDGEKCRSLDSALRAPLGMTTCLVRIRAPAHLRTCAAVIPSERSESRDLYFGRRHATLPGPHRGSA